MVFHAKEIAKLQHIIKLAENIIAENPKPKRGRPPRYNGNGAKALYRKAHSALGK